MTIPMPIIEIGFTGTSTSSWMFIGDSVRGILGTGTLSDGSGTGTLTDVTAYLRSGSIQRGSTRVDSPILRYEPGTATAVLDNRDRRFEPGNVDGPYVASGVSLVKPRRVFRYRATHNSVTYNLYRGYTGNFEAHYDDLSGSDSYVVAPAVDAFTILGRISRTAVAAVGAGEDTGARIDRILDSADWPANDRVIATGDTDLQATTLEGVALDELLIAADTELGEFYMDSEGRAVFRNRLAILTETRSNTSQLTFNDQATGDEVPFHGLTLATDDSTLVNHARITRVGGVQQESEDATSIAENFRTTFERTDLIHTQDSDSLSLANWIVYQSKDPETRFTEITVKIHSDPDTLVPALFPREIGDLITIIWHPPGGGTPIERDSFIRGIKHDFTPSTWETTFTLQSATKGAFLTLNNATLGVLGSNALAY
jgi:hypothetical protein